MSDFNFAFKGTGEVLGINTEVGIIVSDDQRKTLIAKFTNKNTNLNNLICHKNLEVPKEANQLSVFKNTSLLFDASFTCSNQHVDLYIELTRPILNDKKSNVFHNDKVVCHVFCLSKTTQLAILIERDFFAKGKNLEGFIRSTLDFLAIKSATLIVRNNSLTSETSDYFYKHSKNSFPIKEFAEYNNSLLVLNAKFDLLNNTNLFAKGINKLTDIKTIDLFIQKKSNEFTAKLLYKNTSKMDLDAKCMFLDEVYFYINNQSISAGGVIYFKVGEEKFIFKLAGTLSLNSFLLSARAEGKIKITNKIALSQLGLMIGVGATGPVIGMNGRISINSTNDPSNVISFYAGFLVSTLNIPFVSCAITSNKGRISLMDVVVDIADIEDTTFNFKFLDKFAIGDFEFTSSEDIHKTHNIDNWAERPISKHEKDPQNIDPDKLRDFNSSLLYKFNEAMPKSLNVEDTFKYEVNYISKDLAIFTDRKFMRHYRIDGSGNISLNCQLFVCTEKCDDMDVGYFFCGTLEIFKVKARILFMLDPQNSVTAFTEISPINIGNLFKLTASSLPVPTNIPKTNNSGIAGSLIPKEISGPTLYFNVNLSEKIFEFFLSIKLELLKIFLIDAIVIIRKGKVFISLNTQLIGFNLSLYLDVNYQDFSNSNFKLNLNFDSSGFLDAVKTAQNHLKSFAEAKTKRFSELLESVENAKKSILGLNKTIDGYKNEIKELKNKISIFHPVDSSVAIARISFCESAILSLNVSIGVAYGALKIAELALKGADGISDALFSALKSIINCVTTVLWLKSFEIEIALTPNSAYLMGQGVLHILGKDQKFKGKIGWNNFDESIDIAKTKLKKLIYEFVKTEILGLTQKAEDELITSNALLVDSFNYDEFELKLGELSNNIFQYGELNDFKNELEQFVFDVNKIHYEMLGSQPVGWQSNVSKTMDLIAETESIRDNCVVFYDNQFIDNLKLVNQHCSNNILRNSHSIDEFDPEEFFRQLENLNRIENGNGDNLKSKIQSKSLFDRIRDIHVDSDSNTIKTEHKNRKMTPNEINLETVEKIRDLEHNMFINTSNSVMSDFKNNISKFVDDSLSKN